MKLKPLVIYHSADFDGLFCREIARKHFGDSAEYLGWNHGDPVPTPDILPADREVYMLDISIDGLMGHPRLIWIDHHKSAMEKFPSDIPGYRIDGVAACRLAWQWFLGPALNGQDLPSKQEYIDRKMSEPWAVRLAGEYDIWDRRDPDADLFQHGLRSRELTPNLWDELLCDGGGYVGALLRSGEFIQYNSTQQNASIIQAYGFTLQFEGLTFLACNHARFNSHLFTAGVRPEHDALLGFNFDGSKGDWRISLYHASGREHIDLSLIATKYGGGGHRGACGFRVQQLPFPPFNQTRAVTA